MQVNINSENAIIIDNDKKVIKVNKKMKEGYDILNKTIKKKIDRMSFIQYLINNYPQLALYEIKEFEEKQPEVKKQTIKSKAVKDTTNMAYMDLFMENEKKNNKALYEKYIAKRDEIVNEKKVNNVFVMRKFFYEHFPEENPNNRTKRKTGKRT